MNNFLKVKTKEISQIQYRYKHSKIAIVIPAYNEEMNIKNTLQRIPNDLSSNLEIIVIDDGSKDNTRDIAEKFEVKIIKHPINQLTIRLANLRKNKMRKIFCISSIINTR